MKKYIEIANNHINAKINNSFSNPLVNNREEIIHQLKQGETFEKIMDQIEIRFMSITTVIYCRSLGQINETYKKQVRKAFRQLIGDE